MTFHIWFMYILSSDQLVIIIIINSNKDNCLTDNLNFNYQIFAKLVSTD